MEDDRPIAGAVVAPVVALRWHGFVPPIPMGPQGARESTSFRNGSPCSVSGTAELGEALLATGFPAQRDRAPDNNFGSFIAVKRAAQAVRRCGSAAMDLCMVADGTYDGYWERALHAWDTVAASAIVLGAGGIVTSLDGGAPDYHAGNVVASNRLVQAALLAVLAGSS
jgi:myo-inositol-1(or 4)-monophosphatase